MGQKYIVLGRKPDNSVEMIASPSVEFGRQKLELQRHARNADFEEVQMFMLMPHTRAYHPAATLKMEADIAKAEKAVLEKAVEEKKEATLSPVPNEFTARELAKNNRGQLLALAGELVAAKRLDAAPTGSKADIITAILSARPVVVANV